MATDKFLRYLALTGIFVALTMPLIVVNFLFFPFISGKGFFFRILVELALGAYVILAVRNPLYRPRKSAIGLAFALFVIIIGVADIFSEHTFKSFWSNFERMEGLVILLHLLAFFLVSSALLTTKRLWRSFFLTSIGVSLIIGLYGIFQLVGFIKIYQGGVRLDSTFGNSAYLAAYMLMHVFLTLFLTLERGVGRGWGITGAIVVLFQTFILYSTATRGAMLGFLVGTFVTLLLVIIFGKETPRLRKISGGVLIALVLLVAGFMAIRDNPVLKRFVPLERLSSISVSSGQARFRVWSTALQGIKERPVLGWGQESFNFVFNKYYDPRMWSEEPWFDRTHNVILDWAIAGGILGLVAYLSLFALAFTALWKKRKGENRHPLSLESRAVLTGLLAAYFFQNLFVFDNIGTYILFSALLSYLSFVSTRQINEGPVAREATSLLPGQTETMMRRVVPPVVVLAILFILYAGTVRPMMAGSRLIRALGAQPEGPIKNYELYKSALALNTFANSEILEQLAQVTSQVATIQTVDPAIKQKFFDLTKEEMGKYADAHPNDARYQLFQGSFLSKFRQYDEALVYLERARVLSPQKQSILFEIGTVYLNVGQFDKALQIFEETYLLDPSFKDARIIYATGAIFAGKQELAESLLKEEFGTARLPDDRIIRAYAETKQYRKVIDLYQVRLEKDPFNVQTYLALAATYLEIGERTNAITALEQSKKADTTSDYTRQVDFYISEIRAGRNP